MKKLILSLFLILIIFISGCKQRGSDPASPTAGPEEGSINLKLKFDEVPKPGNTKKYTVIFLPGEKIEESSVFSGTIPDGVKEVNLSFAKVAVGNYFIFVFVDPPAEQDEYMYPANIGDFFGVYGGNKKDMPDEPNAHVSGYGENNFDINMEEITENDINLRGTITFPEEVIAYNIEVYFLRFWAEEGIMGYFAKEYEGLAIKSIMYKMFVPDMLKGYLVAFCETFTINEEFKFFSGFFGLPDLNSYIQQHGLSGPMNEMLIQHPFNVSVPGIYNFDVFEVLLL